MAVNHNRLNPLAEENEDVILLTDVVEEPPSEVVLEISADRPGSISLLHQDDSRSSLEKPAGAEPADDLRDFLDSLKELPDDLGAAAFPAGNSSGDPDVLGPEEPRLSVSAAQLREIVREAVQEAMEKLRRELLPQIVREAVDRKIDAWRRRQAGEG